MHSVAAAAAGKTSVCAALAYAHFTNSVIRKYAMRICVNNMVYKNENRTKESAIGRERQRKRIRVKNTRKVGILCLLNRFKINSLLLRAVRAGFFVVVGA